jgi:hypothetical protein
MAGQAAPSQEQQEWTDRLVEAVEDDLAFVLFYCEEVLQSDGVVDWPCELAASVRGDTGRLTQASGTASSTKLTALQAAVSSHGRQRVRKLIVEVLLLSGAAMDARVFELAEQGSNREVIETLQEWNAGGKQKGEQSSLRGCRAARRRS